MPRRDGRSKKCCGERAVFAFHQTVLQFAFVHALHQIERPRSKLYGVVLHALTTIAVETMSIVVVVVIAAVVAAVPIGMGC